MKKEENGLRSEVEKIQKEIAENIKNFPLKEINWPPDFLTKKSRLSGSWRKGKAGSSVLLPERLA